MAGPATVRSTSKLLDAISSQFQVPFDCPSIILQDRACQPYSTFYHMHITWAGLLLSPHIGPFRSSLNKFMPFHPNVSYVDLYAENVKGAGLPYLRHIRRLFHHPFRRYDLYHSLLWYRESLTPYDAVV